MWPIHCVQNTNGAEFHKNLDRHEKDIVVRKGTSTRVDSYSAFFDNNKLQKTDLEEILKKKE